jgi:type I restriction-modification system DNA methylase subunit
MALNDFLKLIPTLLQRASQLQNTPPQGKPEENTKDKLLAPLLEVLGYGPDERTLEANITSLSGTRNWVDYFLLPDKTKRPWLMVEAKPYSEQNLWERYSQQVLGYVRDYASMVGNESPIRWILLTNFREFHILRLGERTPFWSFSGADLADGETAQAVYNRLSCENISTERLDEYYQEHLRDNLEERTAQFLQDLKDWRMILANGYRAKNPELPLEDIRQASHTLMLRLLLVRLLETYAQESFYSLGTLYEYWERIYHSTPFSRQLVQKFRDTWAGYNTELFQESWIDTLDIESEYLRVIIQPDAIPSPELIKLSGRLLGYRSIYNYDFSTLDQDILGTAYEQFLAHELNESKGYIEVVENQETRQKEGIFYTPAYVVEHIVKRVLSPQVEPHIEKALNLAKDGNFEAALETAKSVLEIRVVDPACGSGSFLLGAYRYLVERLEHYNKHMRSIRDTKLNGKQNATVNIFETTDFHRNDPRLIDYPHEQVVVNCIYGVDLDPQAVGLAKLSLWTQLLRANPGQYGKRGSTHTRLPALTLNIRTGNSLIHSPQDLTPYATKLNEAATFAREVKDVNVPETKRKESLDKLEAVISQVNSAALPALEDFFENPAEKQPFNWHVEFADVFDPALPEEKCGFTAVVGNPPYFNVDATFGRGAPEMPWLRHTYPDIYKDKTDILFYFFMRGYQILRVGGELSFIVSRSFLQGSQSDKLRGYLSKNTTLLYLLDFLGHKVFQAGIATAILHYRKGEASSSHILEAYAVMEFENVKAQLAANLVPSHGAVYIQIPQSELDGKRWEISPYRALFEKIDSKGVKLEQSGYGFFLKGMDTGLDEVFEADFIYKGFSKDWLVPRIRISDIFPFGWQPSNSQILVIGHDTEWEQIPPLIQEYLIKNKGPLEQRKTFQSGHYKWFHMHRARTGERNGERYALSMPKIFFPRRASYNRFAVDEKGDVAFKSDVAAFIYKPDHDKKIDLFAVCALLNSKPLNFRYRALGGLGKLTGKGMFEYFENQVGDLPIPNLSIKDEKKLAALGQRAHELFQERYKLLETFNKVLYSVPHQDLAFAAFHDLAGAYGSMVSYTSPNPNATGHLLELRVEAIKGGYKLWGEVVEGDDIDEGEREWRVLAEVQVSDAALRQVLLFRVLWQTEFDETFRRKRKLTGNSAENLLAATFRVLSSPSYDADTLRNLKVLENLLKRVEGEVGKSSLESVMLEAASVEAEIDDVAFKLYDLENERSVVEEALRMVL